VRRVALVSSALVAGAALVSSVAPGGVAVPGAERVVDRTLACTTGVQGGARVIYVRAQSAFGQGKTLEWLAQTTVAAVGQPVPSKPNYRPTLAGMTAGWPAPPPLASGGLGFSNRLCKITRSKVAFVRSGLVGGSASQLGDEFSCVVPRSMLVRVRAVFREPTELERDRSYFSANGRIVRGQIAVTTPAGKPLVYGEVAESGTARLFTPTGCA
jgi:hypothetical protein